MADLSESPSATLRRKNSVAAFIGGRLKSIDSADDVTSNTMIEGIEMHSDLGVSTTLQSAALVVGAAANQVFPAKPFVVRHAFGVEMTKLCGGFYVEIGDINLSKDEHSADFKRLQQQTTVLMRLEEQIEEEVIDFAEAKRRFEEQGSFMSLSFIETDNSPRYKCYSLGGFTILRHQPLTPTSGLCGQWESVTISQYHRGFVLSLSTIPGHIHSPALNAAYDNAARWGAVREESCVGYVNRHIVGGDPDKFVGLQERKFDSEVMKAAEAVQSSKGNAVRAVLIAGPSASGKTTFAAKLGMSLRALGMEPVVLGTDDYYRDIRDEDYPKTKEGKLDHECVEALRLGLLNDHMKRLFAGEEVEVPSFDFVKSRPKPVGTKIRLPSNGVLIMEGIFSLDPRLTAEIPENQKFKIFIVPLPPINLYETQFLFNSTVRTLRRISRDHLHRGRNAAASIARLQNVKRGEEDNIFPTLKYADFVFNSASSHELSVLSVYCRPLLEVVGVDDPTYSDAQLLLDVLKRILPVSDRTVPPDSLLREFIGGSAFEIEPPQVKSETSGDGNVIGTLVELPEDAGRSLTVEDAIELASVDHHTLTKRDSWCAAPAARAVAELHRLSGSPGMKKAAPHADPNSRIIAALVNCEMMPLNYPLNAVQRHLYVSPVTVNTNPGMSVYRATLTYIMHVAAKLAYPDIQLVIPHGFGAEGSRLSTSYFVEAFENVSTGEYVDELTEEMIATIKRRMNELIDDAEPIKYEIVSTAEAAEYFRTAKMFMSEELVLSRNLAAVPLAVCKGMKTLMIQTLAPDASFVPVFDLVSYSKTGMAICFPTLEEPSKVAAAPSHSPAMDGLESYRRDVIRAQRVRCVGEVNRAVFEGKAPTMIRITECLSTHRIRSIVDRLIQNNNRIVLIAGSSSSGKSVFAEQVVLQLESMGIDATQLCMDMYYRDLAEPTYPQTPTGEKDSEHVDALRLDALEKDVLALLEGKGIESPLFDFLTGSRKEETKFIPGMPKNGVLIMEGLFAINDKMLPSIPRDQKLLMLVTPLPLVNLDELRFTSNQVLRTLRRIVRDYNTRGRDARETLSRWGAVGEGEERNSIPFLDTADIVINASSVYEIGAIRAQVSTLLERVIFQYPREYCQALSALKMLSWFHDVPNATMSSGSNFKTAIADERSETH